MSKIIQRVMLYDLAILTAICLVTLLSAVYAPCFANNKEIITVRLFEAHRPLRSLKIFPPIEIVSPNLTTKISSPILATVRQNKIRLSKISSEKTIIASSHSFHLKGINSGLVTISFSSTRRLYRGEIILLADRNNSLNIINRVSIHDYIKGVVASEAPAGARPEMLKAQAVLCQTLLAHQKSLSAVGDSTNSQCYLGASLERPAISSAVDSVLGKLLCYQDAPVTVYYHSTCAGGTSDGGSYFHLSSKLIPYLSPVSCKYCLCSPFWTTTQCRIPKVSFAKVFGPGLPEIMDSDYTGRPLFLRLATCEVLSGYDFWIRLGQSFGWDKCPGTRFKLKQDPNGNIIIESTGAGHGIGLCQWGANELAKKGKNYQQILQYYFPGCEIR